MEVVVPLEESSQGDAYTYDADAHTLEIRLTKEVQGTYYPGLDTLRPQVLSETEMAAFEKDAEREADADTPAEHTPDVQGYPTGLLCGSLQVPAYAAIAASGRVPFLDIVNPSDVALPDRAAMAEEIECDKWDEGMFLYVSPPLTQGHLRGHRRRSGDAPKTDTCIWLAHHRRRPGAAA